MNEMTPYPGSEGLPVITATTRPPPRDSMMAMGRVVDVSELGAVFQPIVSMTSGTIFAYEALVRCSHEAYRSPPDLFARAVECGCVGRLGRMIREIAVPQCAGIPLFLNVHPTELAEGWLVRPDDPIFAHDSEIFLEVTETVPLTHFDLCTHVLHELCSRGGIHMVVDDFGAGFSNLKRIADLEPKVVKLDRELVAGLDRHPRQRRLVSAIVSLCGELDATVVAEGIETKGELASLLDTGVQYGQGYLLGRPACPIPDATWPKSIPVRGRVSRA